MRDFTSWWRFFIMCILLLCLAGGRASSQVFPGSQRADCSSGIPGRFWDVRLHSLQQTGKSGGFYSARRSWLVCRVEIFGALAAHLSVSNYEFFSHFFQSEWCHTLPRSPCPTSRCPPSKMPTSLSASRSTSNPIMLMVRNLSGLFYMSLLVDSRSCCVYSIIFSCLISLRLLSLSLPPSLPRLLLTPSRWEGLILYAGESQSLRTTGTQVWCWLLWLHQTFAYCIQLRAVKEMVHGLCFLTGFFSSWSPTHF